MGKDKQLNFRVVDSVNIMLDQIHKANVKGQSKAAILADLIEKEHNRLKLPKPSKP